MCSTEGKEDCPACGKKRSVDPGRFMVCYTCNQSGKPPKCAICRRDDQGGFWTDLPDGRKLVVCDDCMGQASGDPARLPVPQPALTGRGGQAMMPPASNRPAPRIKIGGKEVSGFGHHQVEPAPAKGVDFTRLNAQSDTKQEDDDLPPWEDPVLDLFDPETKQYTDTTDKEEQSKRAATPLHATDGRVWRSTRRSSFSRLIMVKCPVCGVGSNKQDENDPPLCWQCSLGLNAEAACECCGGLFDRVFPQMRVMEDRNDNHVEYRAIVCGSCLWGYHSEQCDPPHAGRGAVIHPDIFPPTACPVDGNLITDGRPCCSECAERRFNQLRWHNETYDPRKKMEEKFVA